ncbi:MAG TPA: hypothetical protein DEP84_13910 [Chloroflexi bacterium]|nr:hypothetical protein [Chloroflexota bacterium]
MKAGAVTLSAVLCGIAFLALFLSPNRVPPTAQGTGTTSIVSVAADGTYGDGASEAPSISADGRCVAFESTAANLVAGDTNGVRDIFIHDQESGTTERVSVASDGTQANGESAAPSLSADGRWVAFESFASNLVGGDTNGTRDVFVYDRHTGTTERVSVASDGTEADAGGAAPRISADGHYVAFESIATNLVVGDTNGARDIFVHDRQTGTTERVSVVSSEAQVHGDSFDASISGDGRWVAFYSYATGLDPRDSNAVTDVFVHDRLTRTTRSVSLANDGTSGNAASDTPSLSADGRWVAFASEASNLVADDTNRAADVFVVDLETGTIERASLTSDSGQANARSAGPSLSGDGRWLVFSSDATNLVAGDTNECYFAPNGRTYNCTDVFVRNRQTGVTKRVSVASDGTQGDNGSGQPELARPTSLSAGGRWVTFYSFAGNLVANDTNALQDVFVYDQAAEVPTPTATPQNCPPGDLTADGEVNADDVQLIASFWLHQKPEYDFAHDGAGVTVADIMVIASEFAEVCDIP